MLKRRLRNHLLEILKRVNREVGTLNVLLSDLRDGESCILEKMEEMCEGLCGRVVYVPQRRSPLPLPQSIFTSGCTPKFTYYGVPGSNSRKIEFLFAICQ